MKNRFIKRLTGYLHYVDRIVYVTIDGGIRMEMKKFKQKKKKYYNSLKYYRDIKILLMQNKNFETW